MDMENILNAYRVEIEGLLRRHKIAGPVTVETIRQAHDQKGAYFMMDLLKIITPESPYTTDLMAPRMAGPITAGLVIPTSYTEAKAAEADAATTGKAWNFWDNLLNYVGKTAATIAQAKTAINSPGPVDPMAEVPAPAGTPRTNIVYLIAAGFVVLIVVILIFRK